MFRFFWVTGSETEVDALFGVFELYYIYFIGGDK